MMRNLVLLAILLLLALLVFWSGFKEYTVTSSNVTDSETVRFQRDENDQYIISGGNAAGTTIFTNRSMREGSLGGHYRGGGHKYGK